MMCLQNDVYYISCCFAEIRFKDFSMNLAMSEQDGDVVDASKRQVEEVSRSLSSLGRILAKMDGT